MKANIQNRSNSRCFLIAPVSGIRRNDAKAECFFLKVVPLRHDPIYATVLAPIVDADLKLTRDASFGLTTLLYLKHRGGPD